MTDAAPDNESAWDRLAEAYDREVGWPEDALAWGLRCPPESELRVLGDLSDATVLVLGCGGGQDLVALHRLGAQDLIGLDLSGRQLRAAERRLARRGVVARLEHGDAARLERFEDRSVDVVVSVQAFNYVEDLAALFGGIRRVLRPGGRLAFSVLHPADVSTADARPHPWHTSYFQRERTWRWDGLVDGAPELRSWFPTPAEWFTAVTDAGMLVERLLEPAPIVDPSWCERGWLDADGDRKLDTVPSTIILAARRP